MRQIKTDLVLNYMLKYNPDKIQIRELREELDTLKISFKELKDNNNKLEKINHTLKLKIRGSQFKDN